MEPGSADTVLAKKACPPSVSTIVTFHAQAACVTWHQMLNSTNTLCQLEKIRIKYLAVSAWENSHLNNNREGLLMTAEGQS